MKLLLDSHTFVWWIRGDPEPSRLAQSSIEQSEGGVFVSVASAWEIAIKVGLRKWPEATRLLDRFQAGLDAEGFTLLPIDIAHARHAGLLIHPHRDPFDRLLAAQAMIEDMTILTADPKLAALGAKTLW